MIYVSNKTKKTLKYPCKLVSYIKCDVKGPHCRLNCVIDTCNTLIRGPCDGGGADGVIVRMSFIQFSINLSTIATVIEN